MSIRNGVSPKAAALLASAAVVATPALAWAEEAAESGPGMSILIPKPAEFIPALIAFAIIWYLLAKFAWPMFVGILDKRQETIKNNLDEAEAAKIEAQRVLEEYKQQIADARREAAGIVDEARHAGEQVKADITAQAQVQADEMIAKAKKTIEKEKIAAVADLQKSVADLSVSVAGRLIGEDLSDENQRKLIEKYIAEAGTLNAN
ncbi:MAG: F0F1 ATP synthase subunit B [Coriobacteriales bacterium]|nr:F0F1 ATP synthase subunit B [Coriobacteriales bacterium]